MTPNTPTPAATAPAGQEHTATPWSVNGWDVVAQPSVKWHVVAKATKLEYDTTDNERWANAAHIVHCVNTYSQILAQNAALREALSSIERYGLDTMSGPADEVADMAQWIRDGVREMVHRARAALKLVTP